MPRCGSVSWQPGRPLWSEERWSYRKDKRPRNAVSDKGRSWWSAQALLRGRPGHDSHRSRRYRRSFSDQPRGPDERRSIQKAQSKVWRGSVEQEAGTARASPSGANHSIASRASARCDKLRFWGQINRFPHLQSSQGKAVSVLVSVGRVCEGVWWAPFSLLSLFCCIVEWNTTLVVLHRTRF